MSRSEIPVGLLYLIEAGITVTDRSGLTAIISPSWSRNSVIDSPNKLKSQ